MLYLRSFGDDKVPLATIASARRPFFELFSFRGRDPFEEAVAWEFATYGPVVAVGRPGQSLASLGAAREHLSDDTWQEQVAMRMHGTRASRRRHRETPGLRWEVSQVVAGGHLDKAVFVFPPLEGGALARRWEFTSTALAAAGAPVGPLPADPVLIHTAQVAADGVVTATIARARRSVLPHRGRPHHGAPALLSATGIRVRRGSTAPRPGWRGPGAPDVAWGR